MTETLLILILSISTLSAFGDNSKRPSPGKPQERTSERALAPQERQIKVTIATVSNLSGSPSDHYRAGDQILATIRMTNTSTEPLSACISSDLYQNLPKLTKDGELVPYTDWQSSERLAVQLDRACESYNQTETVLLKPNEPKLVDWLVLVDSRVSTGAEAWYDSLPPGKYELSIRRRLDCYDGPMVESNKISFEVVQ